MALHLTNPRKMTSRSYSCGHYLRKACIKVSFRSASVPSVVVHEYNERYNLGEIKVKYRVELM